MKSRPLLRFSMALLVLAEAARSTPFACAVCFGASDAPMVKGMNMAILTLMGVVGTVLFGILAFGWSVGRRSRALHKEELGLIQGEKTA